MRVAGGHTRVCWRLHMTIHGIYHIYPSVVLFLCNHTVLSPHIYGGKAISIPTTHLLLSKKKCREELF
jgi:hypothetical protein